MQGAGGLGRDGYRTGSSLGESLTSSGGLKRLFTLTILDFLIAKSFGGCVGSLVVLVVKGGMRDGRLIFGYYRVVFNFQKKLLPSGRFLKSNLGQKEKAKGRPRVGGGERHVCLCLNVALRGGPACLGLVNGLMGVAVGVGRGSWGDPGE